MSTPSPAAADRRTRLIAAAGELVAARGRDIKMHDVASRAGVSIATAYRQFPSLDAILAAYRLDVGKQLRDFSVGAPCAGLALLDAVCREWIELVLRHGPAMIQSRSQGGYLARLRAGTPQLVDQALALERPLAQGCTELGLSIAADEAMFLWNHLFDPREIMDLHATVGLDRRELGDRLISTFHGALRGWARTHR